MIPKPPLTVAVGPVGRERLPVCRQSGTAGSRSRTASDRAARCSRSTIARRPRRSPPTRDPGCRAFSHRFRWPRFRRRSRSPQRESARSGLPLHQSISAATGNAASEPHVPGSERHQPGAEPGREPSGGMREATAPAAATSSACQDAKTIVAVACAAMPSRRPVKPSPSVVVALTLTRAASSDKISAIRATMAPR